MVSTTTTTSSSFQTALAHNRKSLNLSPVLSIPGEWTFGRGSSPSQTWLDQRWRRPHLAAISLEFNHHGESAQVRESQKTSQPGLAHPSQATLIIQFNYSLISRLISRTRHSRMRIARSSGRRSINLSVSRLSNSPDYCGSKKKRLH